MSDLSRVRCFFGLSIVPADLSDSAVFNGTIDPNGLDNPRAPWSIVNGAAGHYDGLDKFDDVKQNGSAFGIDG